MNKKINSGFIIDPVIRFESCKEQTNLVNEEKKKKLKIDYCTAKLNLIVIKLSLLEEGGLPQSFLKVSGKINI